MTSPQPQPPARRHRVSRKVDPGPSGTQPPVRRRRVTQRDVAEAVGVSSAAVSYAFNGSPGVSEEIRQRIFATAQELGFRPNRAAQGLRKGRMNVIGLLLADIANPFYPELASGVVEAAAGAGFQVFLTHVGVRGERQAEAARTLVDHNCDGLVFSFASGRDVELLRDLQAQQIPFVFINGRVEGIEADWVGGDDHTASRQATEWMVRTGRRRIAIIAGPQSSTTSRGRMAGAKAALAEAGLQPIAPELMTGDLTRASGWERGQRLLGTGQPVDGIMCGNDMIALGVMEACLDHGVAIPQDVSIIGFDDMSFASAGPLQLTTVTAQRQTMGQRAVELLIERIEGYDGPARAVTLPYQLQIRATTVEPPD